MISHLIAVVLGVMAITTTAHARQPVPAWTLEPELRIGSIDDETTALGRVGGLLVNQQLQLYILQPSDQTILVFDRQGRALFTLGRRGRGPGEFEHPDAFGFADGRLWVADAVLGRLQIFEQDRRVAHVVTTRHAAPEASRPSRVAAMLAGGTALAIPVGLPLTDTAVAVPVVAVAADGRVVNESLFSLNLARTHDRIMLPDGAVFELPRAVHFNSLWSVSPDGERVVIVHQSAPRPGDSGEFTVTILASTGVMLARHVFRDPTRPLSPQSMRRLRSEQPASLAGLSRRTFGRDSALVHRLLADAMTIPEVQAPVDRLFVSNDGRIYLRRGAAGVDVAEWLVLEPGSGIVAGLRVPARLELHAADRDRIWGVVHDDLDVPYVVRYRVVREAAR